MALQDIRAKGKRARVMMLEEPSEFGVAGFTMHTPDSESLDGAINAGDSQIIVSTDPSSWLSAGDVIRVSDSEKNNVEYFKVGSGYTTGTTVPLDADTKVNYRHEDGETVEKVDLANSDKALRLAGYTSFSADVNIPLIQSDELGLSNRGISDVRSGLVGASGNLTFQLGLKGSGMILRHALGKYYRSSASDHSTPASDTLASGVAVGDTSIQINSVPAGLSAGDLIELTDGNGDTEVNEIDSSWDGMATTIPMVYEFDNAFSSGDAVARVEGNVTHVLKGDDLLTGFTLIVHYQDNERVGILRGCKISTASITISGDNGNVTFDVSIVAKSAQVMDEFIFNEPKTFTHKPYVPYEFDMKIGGSIVARVLEMTLNIDNQLEDSEYEVGSRFISSADEGDSILQGSFTYQFYNLDHIEDVLFENEKKVEFDANYKGSDTNGEGQTIMLPRTRFGGDILPPVEDATGITAETTFEGLLDETTENTNIKWTIVNDLVKVDQ